MPYSYVKYVGNGTTTTYAVTFPYLDKTHIEVYIDEVLKAVGVDYNWSTPSAITFNSAPANKAVIELRRKSHQESRLVDYQDGSTLTQEIMDLDGNQVFYMAQESIDRSDVVIAKAQEAIDAKELAKQYAEWAYKYERLAYDHMEASSDYSDQAEVFKELAESAAEQTKTAAVSIENARAEIATNRGLVETAKTDVLLAKGLVEVQANLAAAILDNAQTAATQAETVASNALSTANTVQTLATSLSSSIGTVAAQQDAALAAKTAAENARDAALVAQTGAETAATTATSASGTATTKAGEASTAAATATTQAGIATTKAGEAASSAASAATAKTAAEAARDAAQGFASSIDVSNKADVTYVNTQLALKADASSLATVATSGSYNDLSNKPTIPTVPTNVSSFTNDAGYLNSFTETDPVFVASPAHGITSTNIANWDTAYSWGNHASAGYLTTYTETDPVYTGSSWYSKTAPTGTVVGTTDSQTLTNKTFTGYTETVYNLTGTDLNPANGTIQYKTLGANTTFTESIADGQCVTLMLNPATYTVTWPTTTWIGNAASTAPTLVASVYNCITFFQIGGTLYGKYEGRV